LSYYVTEEKRGLKRKEKVRKRLEKIKAKGKKKEKD